MGTGRQNRVVRERLSKEGTFESSVMRRSVTAGLGEEVIPNAMRKVIIIIIIIIPFYKYGN